MLVAVDVINPGDARPEFGVGSYEGLESKTREDECENESHLMGLITVCRQYKVIHCKELKRGAMMFIRRGAKINNSTL